MIFILDKASQLLYDTGHSALRTGHHLLLGPWESSPSWSDLPSPLKASHCLVCRDRGLPDPVLLTGMEGQTLANGFLHNAVLSVSLSMSSRMWPGTSLLAKSECISGKMLRIDSETLELVSLNIPISVLTEYGRSYISDDSGSCGHCGCEATIPRVGSRWIWGWWHTRPVSGFGHRPWSWEGSLQLCGLAL